MCRHPEIQEALRKELRRAYPSSDPSWDELSGTQLPLLDGVVHETLRLHPAVSELVKVVCATPSHSCRWFSHLQAQPVTDDTLPLGTPVTLADGSVIDQLHVPAGTKLAVPITVVNRMRSLWGDDAWEFKPERWANGGAIIPAAAKDIQGHRHLLTFINGPKT
jgi:cytochrome P450